MSSPLVDHIAEAFGLDFSGEREEQLLAAAAERVRARRLPGLDAYLALLRDPTRATDELRVLAGRLTVAESSFFRHMQQIEALVDVVRERLAATATSGRRVRVLSAGCAGGEEPYSLAILLCERFLPAERARVEITGIDVDALQTEHAQAGRYSAWSLRSTPPALRERWFRADGDHFQLDARIRAMVHVETRNLMAPDAGFWLPGGFDIIVCRNVLIYFTPDAVRAVISRLARALDDAGALFLGHSESLRGISDEFTLAQAHDAFFYRKRRAAPSAPPERPRRRSTAAPLPAPPSSPPAEDLYALLREERYGALLLRLDGTADPEGLALRAACLVNLDQLDDAATALDRAAALNPHDGRVHVLLGLVAERRADSGAALIAYRHALEADASLAVAHLYLGRLLRRLGETAVARLSLREAVRLLPQEQERRVALVSGGFARDLLMQVAGAELEACH